ncbi:Delta(24)-sterol reductase, partial [Datura stramonium]|nr:Delta(24)-sterol reductase [Datura stramonium]
MILFSLGERNLSTHSSQLKSSFTQYTPLLSVLVSCFPKMSDLKAPLRPKRSTQLVDFLVQFRWIAVVFFVLPFSCLYYFSIYLADVRSARKSDEQRQKEHEENVKEVVERLGQRDASKDGLVCTARPPWVVIGMRNCDYKRARHFKVDLSKFRNILEINKERMIARVEPLVNM